MKIYTQVVAHVSNRGYQVLLPGGKLIACGNGLPGRAHSGGLYSVSSSGSNP